jgi:adenylyltransferase/sulfurtransferase
MSNGTEGTTLSAANVAKLRIAVAGLGALGNEVVKSLALSGTGHLILIDPDTISERNLTRSVFFRRGSVGRAKAQTIAEVLQSEYPHTRATAYVCEVADVGSGVLAGADLWFSCVHSQLARMEIAAMATSLRIPVIDAGIGAGQGAPSRVTWFAPDDACYGCLLPPARRREILSAWEPYAAPCDGIRDGTPAGISPALSSVVAGLQVELGLQSLLKGESNTMGWTIRAAPAPGIEEVRITKSDLCPFHWPQAGAVAEIADTRVSARAFLAQLGAATGAVVLPWPVCVRARCGRCGWAFAPMQRIALFRRSRSCPRCSSAEVLEVTSIAAVEKDSCYADLPLADLGVPVRARVRVLGTGGACV